MLDLLAKNNDIWLKMAFDIAKDKDTAKDMVQDMYLKLHKITKEINNSYVYFTLKSLYTDYVKNTTVKNRTDIVDFNDYDYNLIADEVDFDKLNEINDIFNLLDQEFKNLRSHEQIIIYHSTDDGLRKFSRDSGISIRTIQLCRKNLKNQLQASGMSSNQLQKP